jgi:hypothetical protein
MREHPDHHDAELMLKLYELRREERLRKAREWFAREFTATTMEKFEQQCPWGSESNAFFRMVSGYWEMVASIVNHGLIKPEFFFESQTEFFGVWERLKPLAAQMRQAFKDPHMGENLESLAADFEKWMSKRSPGALNVYRERIKSRRVKT